MADVNKRQRAVIIASMLDVVNVHGPMVSIGANDIPLIKEALIFFATANSSCDECNQPVGSNEKCFNCFVHNEEKE